MLAPIGGTLLYSISPSLLWLSCFTLCLGAAGLMTAAWVADRTAGPKIISAGRPMFADDPPGPTD
jgi:hypothetical protein